ncbi:unnamed protein product [Litomosoides sigmodontis]|uniref:Uncharacterized protein n=1 Tax=Litomosoides sigmodontis TaxID=42156 RepID=A0A3P6T260_LITSI|nr:unnamed protein product [Litomosoides sigmodontis]
MNALPSLLHVVTLRAPHHPSYGTCSCELIIPDFIDYLKDLVHPSLTSVTVDYYFSAGAGAGDSNCGWMDGWICG